MPGHEAYLLHLYRSRSVRGWQWAARLEHLADGESCRFTEPEMLLAHLQALVRRCDQVEAPNVSPVGADGPAASTDAAIPEDGQRGQPPHQR